METSMLGVPYSATKTYVKTTNGTNITAGGGVEALRVAQSFDPCIACAVH
jgi:Ni,Fe-hydrogenase I large subunit